MGSQTPENFFNTYRYHHAKAVNYRRIDIEEAHLWLPNSFWERDRRVGRRAGNKLDSVGRTTREAFVYQPIDAILDFVPIGPRIDCSQPISRVFSRRPPEQLSQQRRRVFDRHSRADGSSP